MKEITKKKSPQLKIYIDFENKERDRKVKFQIAL
jgi:hypothetical protein